MRELRTKIIEGSSRLGGRVLLYPDKMIWDIGGIPIISGRALVEQLIVQANTFHPTIVMEQRIVSVDKREDGTFLLTASGGERHYSRTIILATGKGEPVPKKLDLSDAECYEGTHLHYIVRDLERFRGKRVIISGGGNSAVDWANALGSIAAQVTVVHRRDLFIGLETNVARMRSGPARIMTPYELKAIHGDGGIVEGATVVHAENGSAVRLEADELLVNHGFRGDPGPLATWGIELEEDRIKVGPGMAASIPGIFAAGDAVHYDSKLKLIAGGFMEGPTALNSAKLHMDPAANTMAAVSTHHAKLLGMMR
jgi:thioredoxin reductase (NADPH)